MDEILVQSSGGSEPSLLYWPAIPGSRPLVVGLHTWSFDRFNQSGLVSFCKERQWGLLLPEFRGPNLMTNPRAQEACASRLARQDVLDAVKRVCYVKPVREDAIFLLGGSGGGHMALMLAAYAPELWRLVSSWVPITDLVAWHGQNPDYAPHIAACCGGVPGASAEVDAAYHDRSPLSHLEELCRANVEVHHGRFDSSVPYTHTLNLALAMERAGGKKFFFEIFDGGHDLRPEEAFRSFDRSLRAMSEAESLTR